MRSLWPGLAILMILIAAPAWAQDAFEIQVYQPDIDAPGHAGLELHLNYVALGLTESAPPELPSNHFFHATLEPSIGLGHGVELGAYIQAAVGPDQSFAWAGAKGRVKIQFPYVGPWGFGVNFELSYVPSQFEPERWGSEIRPIIEYKRGRLRIDINPIISFSWAGPDLGVPHLEPCAAIDYAFTSWWELGVEYYGALGAINDIPPLNGEYHALFATTDFNLGHGFGIHFGVGAGLTPATNGLVVKSIIGKEF